MYKLLQEGLEALECSEIVKQASFAQHYDLKLIPNFFHKKKPMNELRSLTKNVKFSPQSSFKNKFYIRVFN